MHNLSADLVEQTLEAHTTLLREPAPRGASLEALNEIVTRMEAIERRVNGLEREMPKDMATIVVFSGDFDKLMAAFIIASGAAAMGTDVNMFFTFWGLSAIKNARQFRGKTITEKMLSVMLPVGSAGTSKMNMLGLGPQFFKYMMKQKNVQTLGDLMDIAIEMEVEMTACQMSMDVMGIRREELMDGVKFAGVGAYLGDAIESRITLFI